MDQNNKHIFENSEDDELSISELIINIKKWGKLIFSKWKLLILSIILGAIMGFIWENLSPPNYTAVLTFAMEDEKASGGAGGALSSVSGIASQFGIDLGSSAGGAFAAANITELMKSRKIIEKSLLTPIDLNGEKITLADYYLKIYKLKQKWNKDTNLNKISFPVFLDRSNFTIKQDSILKILYLRILKKALNIQQKDKKITIISLEVNSINQNFSKFFCETLAKETSDFYISTKSKKAKTNVEILQKQTDSIRKELTDAINNVAFSNDRVFNLNPAQNIKGANSRRRQADVQANTAILTQLSANLELSKITLRKETPLIQIIDSPILPLDNDSLGYPLSILLGILILVIISIFYITFKYLVLNKNVKILK